MPDHQYQPKDFTDNRYDEIKAAYEKDKARTKEDAELARAELDHTKTNNTIVLNYLAKHHNEEVYHNEEMLKTAVTKAIAEYDDTLSNFRDTSENELENFEAAKNNMIEAHNVACTAIQNYVQFCMQASNDAASFCEAISEEQEKIKETNPKLAKEQKKASNYLRDHILTHYMTQIDNMLLQYKDLIASLDDYLYVESEENLTILEAMRQSKETFFSKLSKFAEDLCNNEAVLNSPARDIPGSIVIKLAKQMEEKSAKPGYMIAFVASFLAMISAITSFFSSLVKLPISTSAEEKPEMPPTSSYANMMSGLESGTKDEEDDEFTLSASNPDANNPAFESATVEKIARTKADAHPLAVDDVEAAESDSSKPTSPKTN